eukprot:1161388-Pelagomonas_calceolata.AAC.5
MPSQPPPHTLGFGWSRTWDWAWGLSEDLHGSLPVGRAGALRGARSRRRAGAICGLPLPCQPSARRGTRMRRKAGCGRSVGERCLAGAGAGAVGAGGGVQERCLANVAAGAEGAEIMVRERGLEGAAAGAGAVGAGKGVWERGLAGAAAGAAGGTGKQACAVGDGRSFGKRGLAGAGAGAVRASVVGGNGAAVPWKAGLLC